MRSEGARDDRSWGLALAAALILVLFGGALLMAACGGGSGNLDPDCSPRDPKFPYCTDEPWDGGPIAF